MPYLTFADLISRRIVISSAEAAALTLAVARVLDVQRAAGFIAQIPDDEWIILSSNGQVSFVDVRCSTEVDETTALSELLRRLLQLERGPQTDRAIPGGLLLTLARMLGRIDVPALSGAGFRASLERFATVEPTPLAAVFWRAAQVRGDVLHRGASRPGRAAGAERRKCGLSRSDLRHALRMAEKELFALKAQEVTRSRKVRRWASAAAGVMAAAAAVMLVGLFAFAPVPTPAAARLTAAPTYDPSAAKQQATPSVVAGSSRLVETEYVRTGLSRPATSARRGATRAARPAPKRERVASFPGGTRPIYFAMR